MLAWKALQSGIHDQKSVRTLQPVQPQGPEERRQPWEPGRGALRRESQQGQALGQQPPVLSGQQRALQVLRAAPPWQGRPELRRGRQRGA
jgi:hypothetical protein